MTLEKHLKSDVVVIEVSCSHELNIFKSRWQPSWFKQMAQNPLGGMTS